MNNKSKSHKTAQKLKTFHVPVEVHICGHETVTAESWEDAIEKAKEQFYLKDQDNRYHGIDSPTIDIEFAECEDDVELGDES